MSKQEIQNLIKDILEKISVKLKGIEVEEESPKSTWYRVEVEEPRFFIDRNGEALQALNHIVRRIIENKNAGVVDASSGILIDVNDFQRRRVENVRAMAHMMSERARYFKSNIEVDPMSAFERRIVHEFLSETADLKTESIGLGPTRRVVIKYIGEI